MHLFECLAFKICQLCTNENVSADQLGLESSSPPLATTATTATSATTPSSGKRNGAPAMSFFCFNADATRVGDPAAPTIFALSKLTACGRAGVAYAAPINAWPAIAAPRMIFLNMFLAPEDGAYAPVIGYSVPIKGQYTHPSVMSPALFGSMPITPDARKRSTPAVARSIALPKRTPLASAVIPYHCDAAP